MSYATIDDLQARYLESDLIALTDENNQEIKTPPILKALDDATAEIDSYLGVRYALPLVAVITLAALNAPAVLVRLCIDITVYRLQVLRPRADVEDARKRYEDAVRLLKLIKSGDVKIEGAQLLPGQSEFPADAAQSPGMTEFVSPRDADPFSRRNR